MQNGDIEFLGKLLNQSHLSLSKLYEVTGSELDFLAEVAQKYDACIGSRMMGGGFGGSTISIVKTAKIDEFKEYVLQKYESKTGYKAKCYDIDISDGITVKKIK